MLKQIRYFQAVVRCGSFTEAAEECYISQSAISQQIQALEQELGVKLLERKNRRFSLTPAGEHFYEKSLILTADFDRLLTETVRIARRENPQLHLGCLKGYSGREFQQAVGEFAGLHPEVEIHVINGTHEELYEELISCRVDVVLSDQRRAFYEDYANYILATRPCYIEISARSPIAKQESVEVAELKHIPCILVASKNQRKNERSFYQERIGITSEFVFAENLEEARLLVIGGKGFMPVEGGGQISMGTSLSHVQLLRNGKPINRNYCVFWKLDSATDYMREFGELLKAQFLSDNVR